MRIGIVSDIHGRADALGHAIELMGEIDRLFALGDSIDEFCFAPDVVAMLRAHDALTIRGNHESAFFEGPGAAARLATVTEPSHAAWLAARPGQLKLDLCGKTVLLVHATPWPGDQDYVTRNNQKFRRFGEVGADIVLYGHTHEPVVGRVGSTLVVNPGSVGHGRPCADGFVQSCAVLDLSCDNAVIIDFRI